MQKGSDVFWRGLLGYLPANVAQGVFGLLAIVTFTRLLSPAEYGDYALGFSVMTLFHTLVFTWLEAAMARFYPAALAKNDLPDHFATLHRAWFILFLAFPVVACLFLWLWPVSPALKLAIGAGLSAVMVRSLFRLIQERMRAAGDVRATALMDITQTVGSFAIGAALVYFGLGGASPLFGFGGICAIALVFALPGELKRGVGGKFDPSKARAYAAYGFPVAASLILALVLATTDRFMLAAWLDETAVGVYHAGYSLANRTLDVIFIWLGMAGGPAMVMALEKGGKPALEEAAREQASLMAAICIPAAVGVALVAHPLADVMVGEQLRAGAAHVTPWIAFGAMFAGFTTYYFHQAFTLGRQTKLLLVAMTVPAVLNVALCAVLIPIFHLDGALWATAASYFAGAVSSWAIGRKVIALPLPVDTILRAGASAAVMALVVMQLPALGGVAELALKATAGGLVYGVLAAILDVGGLRGRAQRFLAARAGAAA